MNFPSRSDGPGEGDGHVALAAADFEDGFTCEGSFCGFETAEPRCKKVEAMLGLRDGDAMRSGF